MKHCKKLIAVLLAAIMLLSMLTACGGGTTGIAGEILDQMNIARNGVGMPELKNDPQLAAIARDILNGFTSKSKQTFIIAGMTVEGYKITTNEYNEIALAAGVTQNTSVYPVEVLDGGEVALVVKNIYYPAQLQAFAKALNRNGRVGIATKTVNGDTYYILVMIAG